MKDHLAEIADRPCEDCGEVHDNCEQCQNAFMALWFSNFDFRVDDSVEEVDMDGFNARELAGYEDEDDEDEI